MERVLRATLDPAAGAVVLSLGIVALYVGGLWYLEPVMSPRTQSDMILLPWVSVTGIAIGSIFSPRQRPAAFLDRPARFVVYGTSLVFLAFCIVVISTASSLPVVEAWKGASPAEIAVSRENFLKAREGWAAVLPYINNL